MYTFSDGVFSFHTVIYGSWAGDKRIVFRVRSDRNPIERAAEKQIRNYDRVVPSTQQEIDAWFFSHSGFVGVKIQK